MRTLGQVLVLLCLFSGFFGSEHRFYIYDLDEEYWWSWPYNFDNCSTYGYLSKSHSELSGIGAPLFPENGLFNTWHFSLFNSLFNRLRRSKYRTRNPEEATLFIIPFDMALNGAIHKANCKPRARCSENVASSLTELFRNSKYFQRYEGYDHVFLWSLGQYHPWPRAGCNIIMKTTCANCAFTCYWMDPVLPNNHFISVPFPSSYHWWEGIQSVPWIQLPAKREYKVIYIGSTQTLNPVHTKIRRYMTQQCIKSSHCKWFQIEHSSTDMDIAKYISHYRNSVFCLCPPGDDPARKALFDIILSGCIPVVFDASTLYNQYPWHVNEELARTISVNVPGKLLGTSYDFITKLASIPQNVIDMKQKAIEVLAPQLQYSIPPLHMLQNRSNQDTWDPPFEDGVNVMLAGLYERAGRLTKNSSDVIPLKYTSYKDWSTKYGTFMT